MGGASSGQDRRFRSPELGLQPFHLRCGQSLPAGGLFDPLDQGVDLSLFLDHLRPLWPLLRDFLGALAPGSGAALSWRPCKPAREHRTFHCLHFLGCVLCGIMTKELLSKYALDQDPHRDSHPGSTCALSAGGDLSGSGCYQVVFQTYVILSVFACGLSIIAAILTEIRKKKVSRQ